MSQSNLPWILVVTHGNFGQALIDSVEMICGKLQNVRAIGLMPGESPEELAAELKDSLDNSGEDAVILVDLLGGTPANMCTIFAKKGYKVITGVSMPMVMAVDMARGTSEWDSVLEDAAQMTKDGIVNITKRVKQEGA